MLNVVSFNDKNYLQIKFHNLVSSCVFLFRNIFHVDVGLLFFFRKLCQIMRDPVNFLCNIVVVGKVHSYDSCRYRLQVNSQQLAERNCFTCNWGAEKGKVCRISISIIHCSLRMQLCLMAFFLQSGVATGHS